MGDEKSESRLHSIWRLYKTQLALLTYKNFLLSKRNLKSTLFQIFSPVLLGLFLIYLQSLAMDSIDIKQVNTSILPISPIPKCHGAHCVTIGVGLTNGYEPWVTHVLSYLADNYQLELGKDIRVLTEQDPVAFVDYLRVHYNETQTGVIFCTGKFNFTIPNVTWAHSFDCDMGPVGQSLNMYSILMNNTNLPLLFLTNVANPMPMDLPTLAVKLALDNAIIGYHTGATTPTIELELQSFPMITSRYYAGYDVVSVEGAFWYFIPPMVTFVVVLEELVREKEHRLRQGLMVMGMSSTPYWHSWFAAGVTFLFLSSNVVIASGCMYDFAFFRNTPYLILMSMFGFFGIAMLMLAFVLATLLSTTKAAYTVPLTQVSYAFLLLGLVLQMFMTNVVILYLLYSDAIPHWVVYVRTILELYPPFNFSKSFGDIARKAANRYSSQEHKWVAGPGYTYHDFITPIDGSYQGVVYHAPSTIQTVFTMLENAAIFMAIAWVCDHVVAGNRGSGE